MTYKPRPCHAYGPRHDDLVVSLEVAKQLSAMLDLEGVQHGMRHIISEHRAIGHVHMSTNSPMASWLKEYGIDYRQP